MKTLHTTEFAYLGERTTVPTHTSQLASYGCPLRPGTKLPNGAMIIAEHVIEQTGTKRISIVLGLTNSLHTPFTSWERMVTTDSPTATGGYQIVDTCIWGHYSGDLDEAILEFHDRVHAAIRKNDEEYEDEG